MLLLLGTKQRRNIVDKENNLKNTNISVERGELKNPYAFSAYMDKEERALSKMTLIEARSMAARLQHQTEFSMKGIATP